jgi:CheY-like chemotaxis protein
MGGELKNLPILVVDDEVCVAVALARILVHFGHEVAVAHSCSEALGMPGSHLVGVFDINLGDGYGPDVARLLVKEGRVRHCVFMTGFADPPRMADAALLGPVFQKGDGMQSLVEHIEELANQKPRSSTRRIPGVEVAKTKSAGRR